MTHPKTYYKAEIKKKKSYSNSFMNIQRNNKKRKMKSLSFRGSKYRKPSGAIEDEKMIKVSECLKNVYFSLFYHFFNIAVLTSGTLISHHIIK